MAELSQFLNSGKVLKVVSAGFSTTFPVTITPAADQYVRFYTSGFTGSVSIGGSTVFNGDISYFGGNSETDPDMDWMGGKGEQIIIDGTLNSVTYQLLEEA